MARKQTHKGAHLYERIETARGKVLYKCMIPACVHALTNPELVVNRLSKCWGDCGREFIITRDYYIDKIKKPMCEHCRDERKKNREMLARIGETLDA